MTTSTRDPWWGALSDGLTFPPRLRLGGDPYVEEEE
jgi:hypothetical protein